MTRTTIHVAKDFDTNDFDQVMRALTFIWDGLHDKAEKTLAGILRSTSLLDVHVYWSGVGTPFIRADRWGVSIECWGWTYGWSDLMDDRSGAQLVQEVAKIAVLLDDETYSGSQAQLWLRDGQLFIFRRDNSNVSDVPLTVNLNKLREVWPDRALLHERWFMNVQRDAVHQPDVVEVDPWNKTPEYLEAK